VTEGFNISGHKRENGRFRIKIRFDDGEEYISDVDFETAEDAVIAGKQKMKEALEKLKTPFSMWEEQ
jgi:hypothetical protein